jgi:outer membrane protein insertion porin family
MLHPPRKAAVLISVLLVSLLFSAPAFCSLSDLLDGMDPPHDQKTELGVDSFGRLQLNSSDFMGTGLKFSGNAKYGDDSKLIRAGVCKEDLFLPGFFAGFDLQGRWDSDLRYRLAGPSGDVYAGFHLDKATTVTLRVAEEALRAYHIDSDLPDIRAMQGMNRVMMFSAILDRSTLDNKRYPRHGTQNTLTWDLATRGLGSEYEFNRLVWQLKAYATPGSSPYTFVSRTRVGWMNGYGRGIPFFERFFLGGADSVRGYQSRMLGTRDGRGLPVGGEFMAVENLEVRRPVYKGLYAAAFFDAGGISGDGVHFGTGVGLRYVTKWGTVRFDYGVRLGHDGDLPRSRFYAGFGFSF